MGVPGGNVLTPASSQRDLREPSGQNVVLPSMEAVTMPAEPPSAAHTPMLHGWLYMVGKWLESGLKRCRVCVIASAKRGNKP